MSEGVYENSDGFEDDEPDAMKNTDIDGQLYSNVRTFKPSSRDGVVASEPDSSGKRSSRVAAVCLGLLCVLLAGIIGLSVYYDGVSKSFIAYKTNSSAEIEQLQTSYNNLTKERYQMQTSYNTLTKERDQLQTSYNTLTKERYQRQTSYNTMTKERANLPTSYNILTEERDQLQTSYKTMTKERDQLQTSYNTMTKERANLQTSYNNLTEERDQLQTSYNTMTKERDQLQTSYNTLTKERDRLQTSYNTMTKERDQLQTERDFLNWRLTNLSWQKFESSWYFLSIETKTWKESREDCLERGADLVIINSREEQTFLFNLQMRAWIGLNDSVTEGTWKWVDGTPLTTGYWRAGQPDDSGQEDCAEIYYGQDDPVKTWNDDKCGTNHNWICEKVV
ncbi:C-type lectin domain family 4 member M-like [Salvelinus alpinus]|uniref:C-type lectin domain family 4 member M-like n=1 Tax=Salvelinus alpinus TaxID=8036 RepID=UPI0039FCE93C